MDYEKLFEQLYDTYYNGVYKYIYVSVKDKWNTEDIISTVFIKIYNNREKIVDVEGSKNWVFRIAHNCIIDFYRKNSKVIPIEDFFDRGSEDTGYEKILVEDEFVPIKKIIDQFPEETKNMIHLRYYGGLKFREIAETINVSENTVKSTVSRAIKKIKKSYFSMIGGDISENR
jgi:RNA polymerase sigma-70 factor, ECF subfamily